MRTQIPPKNPAFTFVKGNVYCFSRAIPKDLKSYYCRPRVIQSLRTTNRRHAVHSSRLLSVPLEMYKYRGTYAQYCQTIPCDEQSISGRNLTHWLHKPVSLW